MPSPNQESRGGEPSGHRPGRLVSLRSRLLLLVLVAFLPLLGLVLYEGFEQRQQAMVRAQENALGLARVAASDQGHMMEGTRQLLMALAQSRAVRHHDTEDCSNLMRVLLEQNPVYSNLGAALPNGDVFCTAVPSPVRVNCGDRPFFQETLRTRDFAFGGYITMRITGKPGIAVVYPALDLEGQVRGVVFAGIDLAWLDEFVAQSPLPQGSTLMVVNRTGTILTRYPDPEQWRGQQLPAHHLEPLLSQEEGVVDQVGLDGVERLYAFTTFCCAQTPELFLRVGIPKSVAFAEANRLMTRNLVMLSVVTLLALALAWGGAHVLVLKPVRALLGAIQRYDAGDFGARAALGAGFGEIGSVGLALDKMAATVQARDAERDRSEEDLRRQNARAEAMASIAARLNAKVDLESVLNTICLETACALSVQAASVRLYDQNQRLMQPATCHGLPADFCVRVAALSPAVLAPVDEGKMVLVTDASSQLDSASDPVFAEMDIRAFLGLPMKHENQLVGALFVFSRGEARRFTDDEIVFLEAISDQAATAVVNARLYESLRQEQQTSARLLRGTITAQEDERKRIARELHDETSQGVSSLILGLDTVSMTLAALVRDARPHLQTAKLIAMEMLDEAQLPDESRCSSKDPVQSGSNLQDESRRMLGEIRGELNAMDLALMAAIRETNQGLRNAKSVAGEVLEGTRRLIADLRPSLLDDLGLVPAIASFGALKLQPLGIKLDLQCDPDEVRLSSELETALFRVAQEAINNIARHSGATSAFIHLRIESEMAVMQIEDNGQGFELGDHVVGPSTGFGLKGMRERVNMLGGEFTLKTEAERGTVVEVRLGLTV